MSLIAAVYSSLYVATDMTLLIITSRLYCCCKISTNNVRNQHRNCRINIGNITEIFYTNVIYQQIHCNDKTRFVCHTVTRVWCVLLRFRSTSHNPACCLLCIFALLRYLGEMLPFCSLDIMFTELFHRENRTP